jgi:RNA polymerase sigma factor (sigma-70 family)
MDGFESQEKPPDLTLERNEVYALVYSAIEDVLTDFETALVELLVLKGCTVAEVATKCHVSRKRIDRQLTRALRKLAQHLDCVAPEIRDSR